MWNFSPESPLLREAPHSKVVVSSHDALLSQAITKEQWVWPFHITAKIPVFEFQKFVTI